jgi:hypothetical protein
VAASQVPFFGYGFVERRHLAARTLQLRPQRLERSAVVVLQHREPLQCIGRKGRAGDGTASTCGLCARDLSARRSGRASPFFGP